MSEKKLIGKEIIKAEIIGIQPNTPYLNKTYSGYYGDDDIKRWDDKPILRLTMKDGSMFDIISEYGGYTGGSQDEYRRFIEVKELKNQEKEDER